MVFLGALMAAAAMEWALIRNDFPIPYVADNGSRRTPLLYTAASLWAALEGSIILWALVLGGYLVLVAHHFDRRLSDPLGAWVLLVMLRVSAFFFGLMLGRGLTRGEGSGRQDRARLRRHRRSGVVPRRPGRHLGGQAHRGRVMTEGLDAVLEAGAIQR